MIYCIWYPSGGFGHFLNAVLSLHGEGFKRPTTSLNFSSNGNSHQLDLIAPKYLHNPKEYSFEFDPTFNYSVLIDNGINNEGKEFLKTFPDSTIIKLCYDDLSWPVVARTMIDKAMQSSIHNELDTHGWNSNDQWVLREKYFLFFRDHQLRHAWRADNQVNNLYINTLLDYNTLINHLNNTGIICGDFSTLWNEWLVHNYKYFQPAIDCQSIIKNVKNNVYQDLSEFTDVWMQSILYYYIWLEFEFEVPHNDYSNWFTDTTEIVTMLENHGVIIDTH